MTTPRAGSDLLGANEPPPVEMVNPGSDYPVVLVCEHAGCFIPRDLASLGLEEGVLKKHIAWDIGAGQLSQCLAARLGATAILQPYSRLVIDCNRPVDAVDAMPAISDGIAVPGNADLGNAHRQARVDAIFSPFHRTVDDVLDEERCMAALAIHSFTPAMDGIARPWDIGFLYRKDETTSKRLAASVGANDPELIVGYNQPYQIDDISDWFVPQHGERRNLPHSLIEIRNDHLGNDLSIARWADRLAKAIDALAEAL